MSSKDDILGVVVRQLVTVPCNMQGPLSDLLEKLCSKRGKEWYEAFLKFLRRENPWGPYPTIVPIDRTKPFNPAEFIGAGWTIWKGPKDGNGLSGDKEQDQRSLALTEVDLTDVRFKTMLTGRETSVKGETKLERLKQAGDVRLDAKVFQTLWENQILIPERWKEQTNGNTTYIFFDGTVLRDSRGSRYVLYLGWSVGAWYWNVYWLDNDWDVNNPSAVLAA